MSNFYNLRDKIYQTLIASSNLSYKLYQMLSALKKASANEHNATVEAIDNEGIVVVRVCLGDKFEDWEFKVFPGSETAEAHIQSFGRIENGKKIESERWYRPEEDDEAPVLNFYTKASTFLEQFLANANSTTENNSIALDVGNAYTSEQLHQITLEELEAKPTIAQGKEGDLKIQGTFAQEDGSLLMTLTKFKLWLTRTGIEDGEWCDNKVTLQISDKDFYKGITMGWEAPEK